MHRHHTNYLANNFYQITCLCGWSSLVSNDQVLLLRTYTDHITAGIVRADNRQLLDATTMQELRYETDAATIKELRQKLDTLMDYDEEALYERLFDSRE